MYVTTYDRIILLQDYARSLMAAPVCTYLQTIKWDPRYGLDISSFYHLFRLMEHRLTTKHF
uniref:Uncharacterized protein n=1 Tax=Anopheles epiroticus TaxID=199890 RepID=A0A182P374_9DIPT